MKDRYSCEMDRLEPRREKLDELYKMIEGGTEMKQAKRLSRRTAAVILACAVLTITAAAAAVPAVWETLQRQLGAFAPYAQTIDGAVCQDQGMEVQVLSALSDGLEARVYFSVRPAGGRGHPQGGGFGNPRSYRPHQQFQAAVLRPRDQNRPVLHQHLVCGGG